METKEINAKISEGYLHTRAIIEIVGSPKEYVKETVKGHVDEIKKNKDYLITNINMEQPVENEGYFSAFAEVEFLVRKVSYLLNFCSDFLPASVEIMEPENMRLSNQELSSYINDMQSRLLSLNTLVIQANEKSRIHVKNTAVLLQNFIVVMLSRNPMSIEELHPYLGVKETDIKKVLDVLIKNKKVKKEGNLYKILK